MMENFIKAILSILIILILGSMIWIMSFYKSENESTHQMMHLYQNNIETLEKFWSYFENEDLQALENIISENYKSFFYPVNQPKGIKSNKKEELERMDRFFKLADNISLNHKIILPGIDAEKLSIDGSVRVYAGWSFNVRKEKISFSLYGFYDFIEDKISLSHEWYDRSGIGLEIQKSTEPSPLLVSQIMEIFDFNESEALDFLKSQKIE